MEKAWKKGGSAADLYDIGLDEGILPGKSASFLSSDKSKCDLYGSLFKSLDAAEYRGKRLKMTASIMTKDTDSAGLWLRVDAAKPMHEYTFTEPEMIDLVHQDDLFISGTHDWQTRDLVVDVSLDASTIYFGIGLSGNGKCWMLDPTFEVVNESVSVNPGWSLYRGND